MRVMKSAAMNEVGSLPVFPNIANQAILRLTIKRNIVNIKTLAVICRFEERKKKQPNDCFLIYLFYSDLHCNVICTPYNGTKVADCKAVADEVNIARLLCKRCRNVACTADNRVAGDLDFLAVFLSADD